MLIREYHEDVPTSGGGSMLTGPVTRFARQIAGHGYIVAAPSTYHEFTSPAPLAYDGPGTDAGNAWKAEKALSAYDEDATLTVDLLLSLPTCTGAIGATGMCLGGHLAFRCAFDRRVRAGVCYFATDIHTSTLGKRTGEGGEGKGDDSLERAGKGEVMGELVMIFGKEDGHTTNTAAYVAVATRVSELLALMPTDIIEAKSVTAIETVTRLFVFCTDGRLIISIGTTSAAPPVIAMIKGAILSTDGETAYGGAPCKFEYSKDIPIYGEIANLEAIDAMGENVRVEGTVLVFSRLGRKPTNDDTSQRTPLNVTDCHLALSKIIQTACLVNREVARQRLPFLTAMKVRFTKRFVLKGKPEEFDWLLTSIDRQMGGLISVPADELVYDEDPRWRLIKKFLYPNREFEASLTRLKRSFLRIEKNFEQDIVQPLKQAMINRMDADLFTLISQAKRTETKILEACEEWQMVIPQLCCKIAGEQKNNAGYSSALNWRAATSDFQDASELDKQIYRLEWRARDAGWNADLDEVFQNLNRDPFERTDGPTLLVKHLEDILSRQGDDSV
ncbi:uncharacterized protein KY384_004768 [Bacidia gigantensis]|uniref:uncharacterized protein n=1 Tax=Bacidia gigantensis TaxID=2732470 RepID=UPI001D048CA1|nr:uncharacterized protein KY384_004768 [Bacidia gigantensis]KAG8530267.1 hypothetical protein KY384_004768 [Bacidia gigantensis]